MLGKNTVLFITDDDFFTAEIIKEELNKDTNFLGITVDVDKLTQKSKIRTIKAHRVLIMNVWKPISKVLHKINEKIKVPSEPYLRDVMNKKKVYNMLFRYAPSAIAVSNPTTRYSIEQGIKRAGLSIKVFAFSAGLGFDYDMLSEGINHYFVDNMTVRTDLLNKSVLAEKIDVTPLCIPEKYYEESDASTAKQRLGYEPTKKLCLVYVKDEEFSIDKTAYPEIEFVIKEKLSDKSDYDLFASADYVATRFDAQIIKRASAMKKPCILLGQDGKGESEYLLADDKTVRVSTDKELIKSLNLIDEGKLTLNFDETTPFSASRIADKIKELIKETK